VRLNQHIFVITEKSCDNGSKWVGVYSFISILHRVCLVRQLAGSCVAPAIDHFAVTIKTIYDFINVVEVTDSGINLSDCYPITPDILITVPLD